MNVPPDIVDHPQLEGKYICLYRRECDDNCDREVCTPELIYVVSGKVERIFTVYLDAQSIDMKRVEEKFSDTLVRLGITTVVSPFFCTGSFLGFTHFLNLDIHERQNEEGDGEIKNWVQYGGIDDEINAQDWRVFLMERSITIRGYFVEEKQFFDSLKSY